MSALLTLPNAVAAVIGLSLTAYALLGGADYGGGVWDLLASGPRRAAQRALVAEAIGPIWEANHVWLILVVVVLFTGFPAAFAQVGIALHIPLTLLLIGIVLRGSAFTFRTYDSQHSAVQQRWGRIFAGASVFTPLMLGIIIGAVASGRVGEATLGRGDFVSLYVRPWLTPFALGTGVLALVLFAFLAAVYLTVEAPAGALREDFRRRALAAAAAVFVVAFGVLLLGAPTVPGLRRVLLGGAVAVALHLATGVAAVSAIAALWVRRFHLARFAAAAQVALILWGWMVAQFPYLIPPATTIAGAAAPARTLRLLLGALAVGALVLVPSLIYLFRIFTGAPAAFERMDREDAARARPAQGPPP